MINQKTQELIRQYRDELPSYHQEALASFDWLAIVREIAAKHRFSERQQDLLIIEVTMLLYQITSPELFKVNLMNHIGVSEATAHIIIMDTTARILNRLQTELERVVGEAPSIMQDELVRAGLPESQAIEFVTQAQHMQSLPASSNSSSVSASDLYREPLE